MGIHNKKELTLIWKWKGPLLGGITQSLISNYLTDPYTFVLYYGLGLEETSKLNQNLLYGNLGHKGLEIALCRPEPMISLLPEIRAALKEDAKSWPYIDASTLESVPRMLLLYNDSFKHKYALKTELQFKVPYKTKSGFNVSLMGKVDGIGPNYETDRRVLVEDQF